MSIRSALFILAATFFLQPAYAAGGAKDQLSDEIIYRVNLGRADDIKLLIEQGASPDQTNQDGVPLLALAAARKDDEGPKIIQTLLDSKVNINMQDKQGKTALFYAAKFGNMGSVNLLLQNKINYYAIDNRGDIARTVAFREGHNNIVDAMDAFVRDETSRVSKQYEDVKNEINQRYEDQRRQAEERNQQIKEMQDKSYADQLKQLQEVQQKAELSTKKAEDARKKLAEEKLSLEDVKKKVAEQEQAEADAQLLAPKSKAIGKGGKALAEDARLTPNKRLSLKAQKLAFHSCSLQYWFYVREAKLPSEMDANELEETIANEKDTILEVTASIASMNPNPPAFPDQLSERAKALIFKEIEDVPTRRLRREAGIGNLQDMQKRCEAISLLWQVVPAGVVGDKVEEALPESQSKANAPVDANPRAQ